MLCLQPQASIHEKGSGKWYSMLENDEYKNILKTLYAVDSKERFRSTFVMDDRLDKMIGNKKDNYKQL